MPSHYKPPEDERPVRATLTLSQKDRETADLVLAHWQAATGRRYYLSDVLTQIVRNAMEEARLDLKDAPPPRRGAKPARAVLKLVPPPEE